MSGGRPASLDGSLLARKGAATPAIRDESPLVLQLDEHRAPAPVEAPAGSDRATGGGPAENAGAAQRGMAKRIGTPSLRVWAPAAAVAVAAIAVGLWLSHGTNDVAPVRAEIPPASTTGDVPPPQAAEPTVQQQTAVTAPPATTGPATGAPVTEEPAVTSVAPVPATASEPVIAVNAPGTEVPPPASEAEATPEIGAEVPKMVAPVPVPRAKPAHAAIPAGAYAIQLASVPDERRAHQEAFRLQKNLGQILGGREIRVEKAVLKSKRTTYRLRASGYRNQAEARAACARIGRLKVDCLPIRR